jgi:threonine 3-dehydrogenase
MKALVKRQSGPGLWLEDVPKPSIGSRDVLVRVLRAGICGTDLHIYDWDAWAQHNLAPPIIIGHEFVGEVVQTGGEVTRFRRGDIVSGEGHFVCGHCRNCLAGRRHLCPNTKGLGVHVPGAFAEYVALPEANVWRHAPGVDLDIAAIFDPFGNAVHTALSFPVLGEDVLVTGAGPIGIMAAAIARHARARQVVITDVHDYRLDLARRLGITQAINTRTTTLADVRGELGIAEGFTVGCEMSGNGAALCDLLANMAHGGHVALLGTPTAEIAIDWTVVVFNMLTLKGIYGREVWETWRTMTMLLESGLDLSPLITHHFTFDDYGEAFAIARSGQAGKIILRWAD